MKYLFYVIGFSFFLFSCGQKTPKEEPVFTSVKEDSSVYLPQQVADSSIRGANKFSQNSPRFPVKEHHTGKYTEGEALGVGLITPDTLLTTRVPEKITVTLINPTAVDIMTGTYYWIDYKNGKNWEVIEFTPNDGSAFVFNDLGISIPAGGREDFEIRLFPEWYQYEPGEYRVRKPFHREGEFTNRGQERVWKNYNVTAYFQIKAH